MPSSSPVEPLLSLGPEACTDLPTALQREWLETDGGGSYASSTVPLCPTRRYHGLLVARLPESAKRFVFLSRFEELLDAGEDSFPISVAHYGEVYAPEGHQALEAFEQRPYPRWTYRIGEARITRELLLVQGSPTVLVRYTRKGGEGELGLRLRPLFPCREADALSVENEALTTTVQARPDGFDYQPYEALPPVHVDWSASARFESEGVWYKDIEYARDGERGYPSTEDQFSPGTLHLALEDGEGLVVAASLEGPTEDPAALWKRESRARERALRKAPEGVPAALTLGAEQFLYRDANGRLGIDAGYPWFGEWGRDTFLALPGLTLARGDKKRCAEVLSGAVEYLRDGLLPNVFGSGPADSHYDSADAALWFARAVLLFERAGGGVRRVQEEFQPALEEIARAYEEGTALGLRVDEEGLLWAGSSGHNATWMDARTSAGPVTPRYGCAVELNALWYSLLAHLEKLSERRGARTKRKHWMERRRSAKRHFLERFWLEEEGRLADVWRPEAVDKSLRPNMVLAAALEFSPLTRSQRKGVVAAAREALLTPCGLRTLAPEDEAYRGRYEGGSDERDGAYHQGTVWPWLFGFYCEAVLRAGAKKADRQDLEEILDGFEVELERAGLGHVSEVFDGDEPRRPGGTIAQAWNTAELLRAHELLLNGLP